MATIVIRVSPFDGAGGETRFRVTVDCDLSDLMQRYAERRGLSANSLRFMFDNTVLMSDNSQTPSSLEMKDGAAVVVYPAIGVGRSRTGLGYWTIKNFREITLDQPAISRPFWTECFGQDVMWRFVWKAVNVEGQRRKYHIVIEGSEAPLIPLKYQFTIKYGNEQAIPLASRELTFFDQLSTSTPVEMLWHDKYFQMVDDCIGTIHAWSDVLTQDRLDALKVYVEISGDIDSVNCAIGSVHDQTALLAPPHKFSDFTVVVGAVTIPVHKLILAEHSAVFAAMFDADMHERDTGRVLIKDIEEDVVRKMIQYMYSRTFLNIKTLDVETVISLYSAANQYAFDALRNACSEVLKRNISLQSVLDILHLTSGAMDSHDGLKDLAYSFYRTHADDITGSPEWEVFRVNYPDLAYEILRNCVVVNAKKRKSLALDTDTRIN